MSSDRGTPADGSRSHPSMFDAERWRLGDDRRGSVLAACARAPRRDRPCRAPRTARASASGTRETNRRRAVRAQSASYASPMKPTREPGPDAARGECGDDVRARSRRAAPVGRIDARLMRRRAGSATTRARRRARCAGDARGRRSPTAERVRRTAAARTARRSGPARARARTSRAPRAPGRRGRAPDAWRASARRETRGRRTRRGQPPTSRKSEQLEVDARVPNDRASDRHGKERRDDAAVPVAGVVPDGQRAGNRRVNVVDGRVRIALAVQRRERLSVRCG